MKDFLVRGSLKELDPQLDELLNLEAERQYRKLILIASESSAPFAVREALASSFQNIYAEGYPDQESRFMSETDILDYEKQLAHYRRFSDPRYYKGVEYANVVEALARRRCAKIFSTNGISPEQIYANVQPLSGAPANNAVYHALIQPGDTIMGMSLLHGGHLTHGSPVNRSGKLYNAVSYTVDSDSERIDYDAVKALAIEHQPKIIIAGYSSYPWTVDWQRFRAIADACGAFLLADIAHFAGLVVAGVYPSPVGIADVITFTTHKSLCGPRGAVIMTTSPKLARLIDRAVFPGEQGGPHINTIAAQAMVFKLAASEDFKALQRQVVANCQALTEGLKKAGFRIPYGGTDTHMTNIDVTSVRGPDGTGLSGDMAARILDLAGIVVNRNTIPGDRSAVNPSGIRLGTPWITQRGFTKKESIYLAERIAMLLEACVPYSLATRSGKAARSKIDFAVFNRVRKEVKDLAQSLGIDFQPAAYGYPHFYSLDDAMPEGPLVEIELEGERVEEFLRWATSSIPEKVASGESVQMTIQAADQIIKGVLKASEERSRWWMIIPAEHAALLLTWLRDLSDGFISIDADDPYRKIPGPVIVRLKGALQAMPEAAAQDLASKKPWYVGMTADEQESLPEFAWSAAGEGEPRRTALYETHKALGAKMVPFAGWEMPVWYSSVLEEHLATRTAAGLFDVSHMGVYQMEGPQACTFLDCVVTNDVASLEVGESLYAQFLDPDGNVLDDTMIYRRGQEAYLVVVNASNDDKDWAWLNGVRAGKLRVDSERPWAQVHGRECIFRNLRDPQEAHEMRVDIALQGPRSREILLALGCEKETAARLKALKWAGVMEGTFGDFDLIVSRTGYTGERMAYELFVHPDKSVGLWKALLEAGEAFGLKPIGLGARDSLRTEAGLPLYGHEMAGEMNLSVGEAGFGAYVKTHKPWFIGRKRFLEQEASREGEIVRFRFNDKGVRMAHYGDPVVDKRGQVIGKVTSCAVDQEGYLLGQAFVKMKYAEEGTSIAIFQSAPDKPSKAPSQLNLGERVNIPGSATVLSRFPKG